MNTLRTTTARSTRRFAGIAALPLVASLALVGCSTAQSDGASSTTSSSSSSGSASGGATAASATSNDALRAAVATARDAVGSGTVISVEQEQNGTAYEVLVVTDDGTEHEVHTNEAGTAVSGSPRTETSDADDRAENERFTAAADLTVDDAVGRFEDLHAGTITELGLDDHLGKVVWEGDVRDASGTKHSVRLDAGTGKVVTDEVDTDD
ncbi:PepSY domain-containing protein [Curtobacterium sp. YR515]|uniref:PepSY domain-containing protein n=1 Tax=Curtobacterium sp. YR515 TaxID=1855316 RepID=UPI0008EDD80E|nr:PepSY domain-containing protein [Curtobacterium sp. YR515]SFF67738.1 Peptidase propeptide and YPEB domain-containing protein [Curtobacterium sp. YR515]